MRKRSNESKKIFLEQKYSKSIIEAGILKSKEIPLEVLRQQKATKMRKLFLSLLRTIQQCKSSSYNKTMF